jgi:hypothetical protein
MIETEKKPRTHTEPLPRSIEELIRRFKQAISLSGVEEVKITPAEFSVRRLVEDGVDVLPKESGVEELPDPEFVLERLDLEELPFDPGGLPTVQLVSATQRISSRRMNPVAIFAPEGPWISAFFGLPEDTPLTHLFGMRVIYSASETCQEKLVAVGSPTHYLTDATYGVIIDIGV